MSDSPVPTAEEEFNAKALNTLAWLVQKRDDGEIDGSQFSMGINVMFQMGSGLIESDILDMITQARADHCDASRHVDRKVVHKNGDFVVVGRIIGSEKLLITKHVGRDDEKQDVMTFDSSAEARAGMVMLIEKLQQRDFALV